MNKKIISVILAMMLTVPALASCGGNKTDEDGSDVNVTEQQDEVMPTFMYFVSNSDADFDAANKVVDELKDEYDGKVNFNIINIDENPDAVNSFPVQGQTPMLIMLNTSNDISALSPKCSDKEQLKAAIDAAFEG